MNKRFLFSFILTALIFSLFSCDLPTTPSKSYSEEQETSSVRSIWSPYIGVHYGNEDKILQIPTLLKLADKGMLKGVRVDLRAGDTNLHYFLKSLPAKIKVIGIIDNHELRRPDLNSYVSRIIAEFGSRVDVIEVGNEVSGFIGISPEEYMEIFKPLYHYVKKNYHVTLAAQSPVGNGEGADRLRRMIDAGLDKLENLEIVEIHFYSYRSTRLPEFKSQITRLPISTKIWVSETNMMPPGWSKQIGYVEEIYPRLKSSLRAERIYWYVLGLPKDMPNNEYALIRWWSGQPETVEYSPLMKELIGNDTSSKTCQPTDTNQDSKNHVKNHSSSDSKRQRVKKEGRRR